MFSRKAIIPRPLHHWMQDPASMQRLRDILADPVFLTACATLTQTAQPTYTATQNQTPEAQAATFNWLAGYNDFLRDLGKMTVPPDSGTRAQEDEWSHIAPEHTLKHS